MGWLGVALALAGWVAAVLMLPSGPLRARRSLGLLAVSALAFVAVWMVLSAVVVLAGTVMRQTSGRELVLASFAGPFSFVAALASTFAAVWLAGLQRRVAAAGGPR